MPNSPNNPEPTNPEFSNPEFSNPESTDPESLPTRQPVSEQSPTIDDQDTGETSDLTGGYAARQVELSYSGPLPDPMTMRAYQALYPKAAQQMFEQFNKETEHRIKMTDREFELATIASVVHAQILRWSTWSEFVETHLPRVGPAGPQPPPPGADLPRRPRPACCPAISAPGGSVGNGWSPQTDGEIPAQST